MTDDFHLFADPDDGGRSIDPDLALISAYLARELSPMQVLAVEERLATDASFRAAMQPLIDAWAAPVASLGSSAIHSKPLTSREKDESWRRFEAERSTGGAITQITHRRVSMKRVAAIIGVTVLPMVSFAQIVSYAAKHDDAPGHHAARRIIAVFTSRTTPPIASGVDTAKPLAAVGDLPVSRPLESSAPATPVAAEPARGAAVVWELVYPKPDRARIIELARKHQAATVRGDTAAEYIVMVFDAADKYLWSTIGSGTLSLEIAGDTRTPAERAAYNREHIAELRGTGPRGAELVSGLARTTADTARSPYSVATGYGLGRGGSIGGAAPGGAAPSTVGRARGGSGGTATGDTVVTGSSRVVASRATGEPLYVRHDTVMTIRKPGEATQRPDTAMYAGTLARSAGGGRGSTPGADSAARPGSYRTGMYSGASGSLVNQASGLQETSPSQSGIQGILSTWVSSADMYLFMPGELAPHRLRVFAVRLTADASWRRKY